VLQVDDERDPPDSDSLQALVGRGANDKTPFTITLASYEILDPHLGQCPLSMN